MPRILDGGVVDAADNPTAQSWRSDVKLTDEIRRGMREWGLHCYLPVQYTAVMRSIAEHWDVVAQPRLVDDQLPVVIVAALQHLALSALIQRREDSTPTVIVLCPAREIVNDVKRVLMNVGKYTNVSYFDCSDKGPEAGGAHLTKHRVLLGTPAQVLGKIRGGAFRPSQITMLIAYQAGEMILRGSATSLVQLHLLLPPDVQLLLTCTKFDMRMVDLFRQLQRNPVGIVEEDFPSPVSEMPQYYVMSSDERSPNENEHDLAVDLIDALMEELPSERVLVLCESRASSQALHELCQSASFSSVLIPWIPSDQQPRSTVAGVADTTARLLISEVLTDENSFQVPRLLVILDCPSYQSYAEKVNMFGNSRPDGIVITFVTSTKGNQLIKDIGRKYRLYMQELPADLQSILS